MLAIAWLATVDATQVPRAGAANVAPEGPARERVKPIWTDHLKVITYPGGKAAAPGDRTSLVIEVPAAGMHIYAPGAEGYKPIPEARAAFSGKPSLTVTGTLSYQACDDRICFNPVTVPLTWTVPLESTAGTSLAARCIVPDCEEGICAASMAFQC
jgi:hypothetical protein